MTDMTTVSASITYRTEGMDAPDRIAAGEFKRGPAHYLPEDEWMLWRQPSAADRQISETESLRTKFRTLADQWEEETWPVSSSTQIYNHWAFREIVGLGGGVVGFIHAELIETRNPHWMRALSEITNFRYDNKGSTPSDVIDGWIALGRMFQGRTL